MTDTPQPDKKKKLLRSFYIFAYLLTLILYAVIGGLLMGMIFPQLPVIMWIVLAGILGARADYMFKGLAWRFEQAYVSKMEK